MVGDGGGGGIGLLKFHLRANNLNLINLGQYVSPRVRARKFVVLFRHKNLMDPSTTWNLDYRKGGFHQIADVRLEIELRTARDLLSV